MGRFDIFPIFIATFASIRVTLIATHSKAQKQTRLPIRYLYFILSFKPLINKEVIKVFQNYEIYFGLLEFAHKFLRISPCFASANYGLSNGDISFYGDFSACVLGRPVCLSLI